MRGPIAKDWHTWASTAGTWTTINGRRVFRIHLVRDAHHLKAELARQRLMRP
ncbi:hypothetical protein [Phycicoccus sp. Root101]|uniref:hypothetical protein n=1 Tax=Phycicoccus sp. Root101 TaxID=1736421 RepID=UPI000A797082|nr:hypothetical protein [Phycicoccus sp. Root101]